jgi:hypothetical protein
MSLRPPNLDDRSFEDLIEEAKRLITARCTEWTDLTPSDPGIVLLEVFAHLTEVMIYRLNRIPEKNYVALLNLIGLRLHSPAAASAILRLSLSQGRGHPVEIPRGTRVTTARASNAMEPPIFVTSETVVIPPGDREVEVLGYHGNLVEGELAGVANGLPGFTAVAAHSPIVAPTGKGVDLMVGVDAVAGEIDGPALQYDGRTFRIWHEVDNFTNLGTDRHVYIADRLAGKITFAPAVRMESEEGVLEEAPQALAEVPKGEVRLWYLWGGGAQGNVSAHTLTTLKDPIPGVKVANPKPATGGRAVETLENALVRGPQELHSLHRAVTARDFELLAKRSSGAVNRAKAFTKATLWVHARPGTIEVILVPHLPESQRGRGQLTANTLRQHQTESARSQIQQALDKRRPLGTTCLVSWASYKTIHVRARVIVHREEDPSAVKARMLDSLYRAINPLSADADQKEWPFGRALTAWDVYKIAGSEPGISSIGQVRLVVDEVPERDVHALAADAFQADTWYVAAGEKVFRSINNGRGWERTGHFPGEEIQLVKAYPLEAGSHAARAGLVAVSTRMQGSNAGSRVYVSHNCGENWERGPQTAFHVEDMAWIERDQTAGLLLATELGLYELTIRPGSVPVQVVVDSNDLSLGFYAVAVSKDIWGETSVALAARGERGVFLSSGSGRSESFKPIGLERELVRVLAVQHRGPHRYLWAGVAAAGTAPGKGCFRWRLTGSTEESAEGWRPYSGGWDAGGCRSIAFQESLVLAGSLRLGVMRLDVDKRDPKWESPDVSCGLPLRDVGRLQPVDVVASDPDGRIIMAGGVEGIYRSEDHGVRYQLCSGREFSDEVTLPRTWLFCSGEHHLTVVNEDAAE